MHANRRSPLEIKIERLGGFIFRRRRLLRGPFVQPPAASQTSSRIFVTYFGRLLAIQRNA
jgi:hypothetical protein